MSEAGKVNEAILNQLKKESHRRVEIEAFKSAASCAIRASITTGLLSKADMILALKEIIADLENDRPTYEETRAYEEEIRKALGLPKDAPEKDAYPGVQPGPGAGDIADGDCAE